MKNSLTIQGPRDKGLTLVHCVDRNVWKFLQSLKKKQFYVEAQLYYSEAGVRKRRNLIIKRREINLNILNEPFITNLEIILAC